MTVTGADCCALDASPRILSNHPSKKWYLFMFQEPSCFTASLLAIPELHVLAQSLGQGVGHGAASLEPWWSFPL